MGLAKYMAKEVAKEIGNKSREFYEFVLPPVDMTEEGDNLVVKIDVPGFTKKDIKLSISGNVLSINAKKEEDETGTVIWKQRPSIIDKKIQLPMRIKEGEEQVDSAKYADGVFLTGCREGDCCYRLGIRWTEARLAAERDPRLRQRVKKERIGKYWAGLTRRKQFFRELKDFRSQLHNLAESQQQGMAEQTIAEISEGKTNA